MWHALPCPPATQPKWRHGVRLRSLGNVNPCHLCYPKHLPAQSAGDIRPPQSSTWERTRYASGGSQIGHVSCPWQPNRTRSDTFCVYRTRSDTFSYPAADGASIGGLNSRRGMSGGRAVKRGSEHRQKRFRDPHRRRHTVPCQLTTRPKWRHGGHFRPCGRFGSLSPVATRQARGGYPRS